MFDDIIENRICFGSSQEKWVNILGVFWMIDAAEFGIQGFISPIIQQKWDLSQQQLNILISLIFLGWGIGGFLCGWLADTYGRQIPVFMSAIGVFVFGSLCIFSQSFNVFMILRFLVGLSIGLYQMDSTMLSEIVPRTIVGRKFVFINYFFILGEFVVLVVAYFALETIDQGDYRIFLSITSILGLIVLLLVSFLSYESPRFLMLMKQSEKSVAILNQMGKENKKDQFIPITNQEKQDLIVWADKQIRINKHNQANFLALFTEGRMSITLKLCSMWITISFIYYGITYSLPSFYLALNEYNEDGEQVTKNDMLFDIFLSILAEIPSIPVGIYLIDQPFSGRKNTLFYCFSIQTLLSIILYAFQGQLFIVWIMMMKMISMLSYTVLCIFSAEIYSTMYRATGACFQLAICRLGGIFMPWCMDYMFTFGPFEPFLFLGGLCFVAATGAYLLPKDTREEQLDHYFEADNLKEQEQDQEQQKNKNDETKNLIQPENKNNDTQKDINNSLNEDQNKETLQSQQNIKKQNQNVQSRENKQL